LTAKPPGYRMLTSSKSITATRILRRGRKVVA
jgi:hypothetical protein